MPNLPVATPAPYPTRGDILNLVRVICNDAATALGLSGDLLSDSQPYTDVYVQSAWHWLQDELADAGVERFSKEILITGLPAVTVVDPSIAVYMDWGGFYDGTTYNTQAAGAPVLPADLIVPSFVWERQSGANGIFTKVTMMDGGLPDGAPEEKLRYCEWRDDKLYFRGATGIVDIKLRYIELQPDIDTNPYTQVPVMRSKRAMAYAIASEWARTLGSPLADNFYAMAQSEMGKITLRTSRRKQAVTYRRRPFGDN